MIPPVPKNLTLISLHQDEDHYLNRLESVIEYISSYDGDEEWEYVRSHLELKLMECKLLYLVWRDEEY